MCLWLLSGVCKCASLRVFEWLADLKWEDAQGHLYVAGVLIRPLVWGEREGERATFAISQILSVVMTHGVDCPSCILYIPPSLAVQISMAVT